MRSEILQLAADLTTKGRRFVMAVVVRREPASSAQVGNTALITEAGIAMAGSGAAVFSRRSCAKRSRRSGMHRPTDLAVARSGRGQPTGCRVVSDDLPQRRQRGHLSRTGASGPALLVFGISPTAQALVRLAKNMGYTVDVADPDAERAGFPDADRILTTLSLIFRERPVSQRGRLFAVVATLGQHDEESTLTALASSRVSRGCRQPQAVCADPGNARRSRCVAARARRHRESGRNRHRRPHTEEVALSILAEIVRHGARRENRGPRRDERASRT